MAQHLEKTLSYEGITSKHFLSLAREVIKKLNWTEDSVSSTGIAAHTTISGVSWGEVIRITASNSIATISSECTSPGQIIDWGKNRRNVDKFISTYNEIKDLYYGEQMNTLLNDFEEECSKEQSMPVNDTTTETEASPIPTLTEVLTFQKNYIVTPTIVAINVLVFIIMVSSGVSFFEPSTLDIVNWGGNFRPYTLNGQWWRLISNVFVHIGIIHIAFNMYALLYIGVLLEPYLGKLRFAVAYILTGIAASVVSLWWHDNTVSAGASGAIFGMYGVFLALLTTKNVIDKSVRSSLLASIGCFIAYNLLYGLKGGIDNAAHIGGLISGLIIGYAYLPSLKKNENKKLMNVTSLALTVAVVAVSSIVCSQLQSPLYKNLNENETKTPVQEIYNEKFKWRITIPENFIAIGNNEQQEILQKTKNAIQNTYGEDVEIDTESTKNIFVFRNGKANAIEANYSIYDSTYYKNYDESCNDTRQAMYDMLKSSIGDEQNARIDTVSSVETINGLQFHKLTLTTNGKGIKIVMVVFLHLFGNEELCVIITYIDEKKGEQMIDAFRNSTFGK